MKPISAKTLEIADSFWEQKKNEFLVAVYEQDVQAAEQIYEVIVTHAEACDRFSENSEKILHQIQTIFKRFSPILLSRSPSDINATNKRLNQLILNGLKRASTTPHVNFHTWETRLGLDGRQKNLVYKTAMTFQLTSGCSNYCRRCNEWALPRVRSHFAYPAIQVILDQMTAQQNKDICLYGASDPLDWEDSEKTLVDIIAYCNTLPLAYSLLTKVPRGKEAILKTLLKNHSNLSVSQTFRNKTRIQKIEQDLGYPISKQHDLDELLIPARLDEDFVSIKPSITDGYGTEITPDGAWIIVPTFTSALHPFGHEKIAITADTWFFPVKKTGRNALLVDYFKPIEGVDLDQNPCHLPHLLTVQIESIILDNGTDELTPPGMRSLKEYLSIFEEPARLQRKKLAPTVFKKIKTQVISSASFKTASPEEKTLYLKKIQHHLTLCREKTCAMARIFAISFFLGAIFSYAQTHSVKLRIIQFLLTAEMNSTAHARAALTRRPVNEILAQAHTDTFDIFRQYVFCLINRSDPAPVLDFIKTYRSAYDPVADIFVACNESEKI